MTEKQSIYVGNGKRLPNDGLKFSICLDDWGSTHSIKIDYEKP